MRPTIASITWPTSLALILGRFLLMFKLRRLLILVTPMTTLASSASRRLSDTSNLDTQDTPGRACSITAAPPDPKQLVEIFNSTSEVDSLHAKPSNRDFRGSLQCERLRYLSPSVVAKNCLKVGGTSPL